MRHRAVRPGGDDRLEREALGAVLERMALHLPGQLALADARPQQRGRVRERLVAEAHRARDRIELFAVLDRAQRLDRVEHGLEAGTVLDGASSSIASVHSACSAIDTCAASTPTVLPPSPARRSAAKEPMRRSGAGTSSKEGACSRACSW